MNEADFAFWFSLLISSLYSAHEKTWQAAIWLVASLIALVIGCFD